MSGERARSSPNRFPDRSRATCTRLVGARSPPFGSTDGGSDEAVRFLAQEGYDPEYGARPLRRTITRLVENELSRLVLGGDIEPGDRVQVEIEDGKLRFDTEKGVFEQKRCRRWRQRVGDARARRGPGGWKCSRGP